MIDELSALNALLFTVCTGLLVLAVKKIRDEDKRWRP